jgi:asparagine synthase (glutamine-hydrolysing)
MRGGFVACLSAKRQPVERAADRLRWHRGRAVHHHCNGLDVSTRVDAIEGPTWETHAGVTRLVHGATPAPLAQLERTATRFAAIEWDGRTLRASRDAMGQAPLFYRRLPEAVWLATEVEPLVSLETPEPDLEALSARAAFVPMEERTGWREIHRVLPGGAIEVDARDLGIVTRRYWEPARRLGCFRGGREEALAEFRERFATAVRSCFEPSSGILLSGGLDSSAVALTVPEGGRDRARLVHVHFAGLPETHEDGFAAAVARKVGAPLHTVAGDASPWNLEAELDLLGIPYNWFPYGLDAPALGHLAAEGTTVALDGHDADGVLGPPGGEWGELILEGAGRSLASFWRAYGPRRALRGVAAAFVPPSCRPRAFRAPTYMEDVARYFVGPLHERILREDIYRWRWPSAFWRVRQIQPLLPRATVSLEQKELEAASHGIDLRHPFADRALVDFLVSLPCAIKGDPGRAKPLLRDAMEATFPPLLHGRSKGDYRSVLQRRVDPARCVEGIRTSKARLPGVDYRRLFDDAARGPEAMPLLLLITLARAHEFVRRATWS